MTSVLVLGGTLFLGRHVVAAARSRRSTITILTRGRIPVTNVTDVEHLRGDRDGDLSALEGRRWDVVVDTSAYHPRHIERVASALPDVGRYVLLSTASVYRQFPDGGASESAPTHEPLWDASVDPGPDVYGPLKRACEEAARRHYPHRTVVIRPGVLVGPYDPTGRFPYWFHRIAAGGEVLAPGSPDRVIQLLDARDLAAWILDLPASVSDETLNVAGPTGPLTMLGMLSACCSALNPAARFTWVTDEFLLQRAVVPWKHLPLWLPRAAGSQLLLDDSKARSLGLRHRSLQETIKDIHDGQVEADWPLGGRLPKAEPLSRAREAELLRAWHDAVSGVSVFPARRPDEEL